MNTEEQKKYFKHLDESTMFGAGDSGVMRTYGTGATRDTKEGKLHYHGFLNPVVLLQFAKYMSMNRLQSNGELRDPDNWQKGMDQDDYIDSLLRHSMEAWLEHSGHETKNGKMAALCGIFFNTMGYMLEEIKKTGHIQDFDGDEPTPEILERMEKLELLKAGPSSVRLCCGDCNCEAE